MTATRVRIDGINDIRFPALYHCRGCDVEWTALTDICWHCGHVGEQGRGAPPFSSTMTITRHVYATEGIWL